MTRSSDALVQGQSAMYYLSGSSYTYTELRIFLQTAIYGAVYLCQGRSYSANLLAQGVLDGQESLGTTPSGTQPWPSRATSTRSFTV